MQPHQERVVTEKKELDDKASRLKAFCFGDSTDTFRSLPPEDRHLLEIQFDAMRQYSDILARRIARFK